MRGYRLGNNGIYPGMWIVQWCGLKPTSFINDVLDCPKLLLQLNDMPRIYRLIYSSQYYT